MTILDRFLTYLSRRRKARHVKWLRKNRVLLAPDRAVQRGINTGWWS